MSTPQSEFTRCAGLFHPQVHTVTAGEEIREKDKGQKVFWGSEIYKHENKTGRWSHQGHNIQRFIVDNVNYKAGKWKTYKDTEQPQRFDLSSSLPLR